MITFFIIMLSIVFFGKIFFSLMKFLFKAAGFLFLLPVIIIFAVTIFSGFFSFLLLPFF